MAAHQIVDDTIILSNNSNAKVPVQAKLTSAEGSTSMSVVDLAPRQVARRSLRSLLGPLTSSGAYGGLEILPLSHASEVDAIALALDETVGFGAMLKMFDHDPEATVAERDFNRSGKYTLRAPMLALTSADSSLLLPPNTVLHPRFLVRNVSPREGDVGVQFNWKGDSFTGTTSGPDLHLKAFETKLVSVDSLPEAERPPLAAHWASVYLSTKELSPDDLVAVAASYDDTFHFGAQTPFSDQLSGIWKGGEWQYDGLHDSIITIGNGSGAQTKALFTLFYDHASSRYELEKTLDPDEQMWIDVGQLIRGKVPDKHGNVLPGSITSGSYEFRDLSKPSRATLFEGKVIYDKTNGHASYGCAACCAAKSVYLNYNPLYVATHGNATNGVSDIDDCGDGPQDISSYFYNWSTANTAIATTTSQGVHSGFSQGSTTSSTNGQVLHTNGRNGCYYINNGQQGNENVKPPPQISSIDPSSVLVGSQGVQITIKGSNFGESPSVNLPSGMSQTGIASTTSSIVVIVNVSYVQPTNSSLSVSPGGVASNSASIMLNGPAYTRVQSDTLGTTTNNPSGTSRFVTYQVYNLDDSQSTTIPIAENITFGALSCAQPDPGHLTATCNGAYSTDANGVFSDEWSYYSGYTPAGCGLTIVDHWQWCSPSGPSSGITFQTLSGYIHTSDSQINGYANPPSAIPPNTRFVP